MSRVILLRHGHSTANAQAILAGRTAGVELSEKGLAQGRELVLRLGASQISHVRVSPLKRCSDTIEPWLRSNSASQINSAHLVSLEIDDRLNELDYGSWTNRKLKSLARLPLWKTVQEKPSKMIFPDGESMAKMQKRAVAAVSEIAAFKGGKARLVVSHGDVIKAIVAHYLNQKLDDFQRIVIDPCSISILDISKNSVRVITMNSNAGSIEELVNSTISKKALLGGGAGRGK